MEQEKLRKPITIKRTRYEKRYEKRGININRKEVNGTPFIIEAGYVVLDRNVDKSAGNKMMMIDLQLHVSYSIPFGTIYPFIWGGRFDEEPKRLVTRLTSSMEYNS